MRQGWAAGVAGMVAAVLFVTVGASPAAAINGGTPVPDGQNRFVVDIEVQSEPGGEWQHLCGGSLLSPTVVLTALHCTPGFIPGTEKNKIRAVLDRTDRQSSGGITIDSDQFTLVRPEAVPEYNWDAALLILDTPVTDTPSIDLPRVGDTPAPGTDAVTAGWGFFSAEPIVSDRMRQVATPVVACGDGDDPVRVCAGSWEAGPNGGDSGGPLFTTGEKVRQLGVVSGGGAGSAAYTNLADPVIWDELQQRMLRLGLGSLQDHGIDR